MEAKVQQKLIKYLKSKGSYVVKTKPGSGTPKGCPDVLFFHPSLCGVIECKAYEDSPYQVLQPETLELIKNMGYYSNTCHSENYDYIIAELEQIL